MKGKKTLSLLLCSLIFTGCSLNANEESGSLNGSQLGAVYYGGQISVNDIKQKFGAVDDATMPLYNVAPDEIFTFNFKANFDGAQTDAELVTIHTDESCSEESRIDTKYTCLVADDGTTLVTVSSAGGVLLTDSEETDGIENDRFVWGNAPMYYIAVHYDMEAGEVVKLKTPKIVPFTVKSEVAVPNVKGEVDSSGSFKLVWDAVDGASEYIIYSLSNMEQQTGVNNAAVLGAQNGYSDAYLIKYATTTATEFDDFGGDGAHSIATHERSVTGQQYIIAQNLCVNGEYYVSAVVNGKESAPGAGVATADLILPYALAEENDIMLDSFASVSELPLTVDVLNIDGSKTSHKILYTHQKKESYTGELGDEYAYVIEGTALTGCVDMSLTPHGTVFPETIGGFSNAGASTPDSEIEKIPSAEVDTIIDPTEINADDGLVQQQDDNTQAHVEEGNQETIAAPSDNVRIFADDAGEEWLALNLVNGKTEISLEAFPSLQNPYTLEDVFYKVYYQNPYIIGAKRFSYDFSSMTLGVEYVYDADTIKRMQSEISAEAKSIIAKTITSDMTDEAKRLALYGYLESSCSYDNAALENAKANNYTNAGAEFENSFNAYGIIVKKLGVCQSYAYAYKLLCAECGVDCKVITGYFDGSLPHAWNLVNIDGSWYGTDVTNNESTSGIPFFLYNSDTETAENTGFTADKLFELDSKLDSFNSVNASYEYYHSQNLVAENLDGYKAILDNEVADNSVKICVRYTGAELDQGAFVAAVKEIYNKHGLEAELGTLDCLLSNGFIYLRQNGVING